MPTLPTLCITGKLESNHSKQHYHRCEKISIGVIKIASQDNVRTKNETFWSYVNDALVLGSLSKCFVSSESTRPRQPHFQQRFLRKTVTYFLLLYQYLVFEAMEL